MEIKKIAVIGAGTMGNGITQVCAAAGLSVVMQDVNADALQQGMDTISGSMDRMIKKEKINENIFFF